MNNRYPISAYLTGATMAMLLGGLPAEAVPPTTRGGNSPVPAEAPESPTVPAERELPPVTRLSQPLLPMVRSGSQGAMPEGGPRIVYPRSTVATPSSPAPSAPAPAAPAPARRTVAAPAAKPARPAVRLATREPDTVVDVASRVEASAAGPRDAAPTLPTRSLPAPPPVPATVPNADGETMPSTVRTAEEADSLLEVAAYEASRRYRLAQNRINYSTFNQGLPQQKLVALTFDDGPDPAHTPKVLQVLRKHKVVATFFVIGRKIDKHQTLIRRTAAEGHDLGNHTYHHFDLTKIGQDGIRFEIERTNQALQDTVGGPSRWFRAPGCKYSPDVFEVMREMDMIRVDTTNNSGDWAKKDPKAIVNRVTKQLAPGDVILCHDNIPQMVSALPALIKEIRARGYRFVSLAELAQRAQANAGFQPLFWPAHQGIVIEDPRRLTTLEHAHRRGRTETSRIRAIPVSSPKRTRRKPLRVIARIRPQRKRMVVAKARPAQRTLTGGAATVTIRPRARAAASER